jgi:pyruvate kinase
MGMTRRTKIVATIGPATSDLRIIDALIGAGVDVFRLNFSHGTHESHAERFRAIRERAVAAGRHVAILQDLSGPKIRTGSLRGGQIELRDGDEVRLVAGDDPGGPGLISVPYEDLISSVRPGDCLLIDDGKIELRVTGRAGREATAQVVHGGPLGEHKGINAPGVRLPAAAITPKDEKDLEFGLKLGVDLVALSFVQTADDVRRARAIVAAAGSDVPLIAKIERPNAVEALPAIVEAADGVMVARGDLGLECPLESVPRIQKEIIQCARTLGRPVIVATQVLESMRTEPRPTRAEVSDAATAVDQGADAIMLAGETAVGEYPVEAVKTLAAVICNAEALPVGPLVLPPKGTSAKVSDVDGNRYTRALCEAAVTLATAGGAEAIVAVTREGHTPRLLSALRPRAAILAVTPSAELACRLALWWGVQPLVAPAQDQLAVDRWLSSQSIVSRDAVVVFVNVSPDLNRQDANYINVQRIGS